LGLLNSSFLIFQNNKIQLVENQSLKSWHNCFAIRCTQTFTFQAKAGTIYLPTTGRQN